MPDLKPSATPPIHLSLFSQRTRFSSAYSLLEQAVADRVFPGCSFGVLEWKEDGAEIAALDAIGSQTYAPDSPRILPGTQYDLASLTKVMATTAMAMLLYERGAYDLDQPLNSILPGFGKDGARSRVTMRQLMAHASGLPGYVRLFETERTPQGLLQACLALPLQHEPGTHAEYSDIGFILLGKALEAVAGESIDAFCQREVFGRCGMDSTLFVPPAVLRPAIPPTEEDTTFRHRVIQGEVQDENCFVLGGVSGHAGLFGDAFDVLRFAAAILQSRQDGKDALVRPETLRLFAARAELPLGSSRALGWDTPSAAKAGPSSSGSLFSENSIGHLGYAGTSVWIDLTEGVAIVLLTNRTWPSRESQEIRKVRPLFHDAIGKALRNPRNV